jgi:hypothetical protein
MYSYYLSPRLQSISSLTSCPCFSSALSQEHLTSLQPTFQWPSQSSNLIYKSLYPQCLSTYSLCF